jgi:hypothetical protein
MDAAERGWLRFECASQKKNCFFRAINTTLCAISCGTVHSRTNARDTRGLFSKSVLNGHPNVALTAD